MSTSFLNAFRVLLAGRHLKVSYTKRLTNFLMRCPQTASPCKFVPSCDVSFHTSQMSHKKRTVEKTVDHSRIRKKSPKSMLVVEIWRNMTVAELASAVDRDIGMVYEAMIYVPGTDSYDSDRSVITDVHAIMDIVKKLGMRSRVVKPPHLQNIIKVTADEPEKDLPDPSVLVKRAPIVTVMGHVDHGKTTLLDTLRQTAVAAQEFGGITQHIGAFKVKVKDGESITFLDTPGHAAFYAMRARGAEATDIVVLVVAADDGVMQQTVESINHAKEANVPIIVAINKIDRQTANLDICKRGLMEHGVQLEDCGGDVQCVPISALKGTNMDLLVEAVLTQAELMGLKGDPGGLVEGYVIESRTDPDRGKLSTAIVKRGTLRKGAILVAGTAWAKVRGMFDENGNPLQSAGLSTPVEIVGWRDLPSAGDNIVEVRSEARAGEIIRSRMKLKQEDKLAEDSVAIKVKLDEHLAKYRADRDERRKLGIFRRRRNKVREKEAVGEHVGPRLQVILKGDVDGSVEAILDVLDSYSCPGCTLDIVHYGVGQVTEGDVDTAATFKSIVYAFNVKVAENVKRMARKNEVVIKEYNIIYRLIDDIKEEIGSRLPYRDEEEVFGVASVVEEFIVNERRKKWPVAGCRCVKGLLRKKANFRIVRGESVVHEGKVVSLRHLKQDVDTINKDMDCGIRFEDGSIRFQPGDTIQCYVLNKVSQKLNWETGF